MKTQPLTNANHEKYVLARVAGKSQRQAMLEAYPHRSKWKEASVDIAACKLENDTKVKQRLQDLQERASKK